MMSWPKREIASWYSDAPAVMEERAPLQLPTENYRLEIICPPNGITKQIYIPQYAASLDL